MKDLFAQGGQGSVGIKTNKQAIARHFGVKQSEIVYFTVGAELGGYKFIYDKETQRSYSLPILASGTTAISLSADGTLVHSTGSINLADLAVLREEYVRINKTFITGFTLEAHNEIVSNGSILWRWGGVVPKTMPENSSINPADIAEDKWWPVGENKALTLLEQPNGASLIMNGSVSIAEQIDSILSHNKGIFFVDDYGAKGDSNGTVGNGTDDTAAIYACFQASIAAGGGKIIFTPGKTYRTSYTVIFGSNTIIDMQGAAIFFDVLSNDGSAFMPDSFQSYTTFTTDVIFMNGQINGRTGAGNGIGANRARRITLFNIGSKYLHWHLFDGAGAQQIKIIDCWCEGTNASPFQADNAAYDMASWGVDANNVVLPISFDATGTGGWSNCRDMLVMGCTVRNAAYTCVHIHNNNNQNIQVVNCHFEDSAAGIFADSNATFISTNVLIQDCTFIRCTVPVNWGGGFNTLRILDNNFYGENTTTWYYGVKILLPAAGTLKALSVKDNTFTGLYRPVYVNGVTGFSINDNIFHTCGGTTPPASGSVVSNENPLAILRVSGCKSGSVSDNTFQDCFDPVCISVARDEVDSSFSISVEVNDNISRSSGCLLSMYYADRCSARDNKYVGLANDFFGVYVANSCVALVLESTYISQGTGRGIYIDGGARHVVRDNVLFSTGTDLAIMLNNCVGPKTSGNIVTGGYASTHVTIAGSTSGAILDEAFATVGKTGAAAGTKVTYATTAI